MLGLFGGHLPGPGAEGLGSGEDVEPEVAAAFGPFVVPLGQDGADEAGDRVPVGADADHVGAVADLLVEPVVGVVRPDLLPDILGNAVKARMPSWAFSRCSATRGSFSARASATRSKWAWTDAASG